MNCKNCGAPLKDGMTFCSQCGTNNAQPVNQAVNPTPAPAPQPQQQPQQPQQTPPPVQPQQAQNAGGYTAPQPQYYYPQPQAPKKPFEEVIFGLNWAKISVIAAIIVGGLFVLSGFIGMFSYVSFTYDGDTSVSGVFTSLFNGVANGVLWATVIVLLGKIADAVCSKHNDKK